MFWLDPPINPLTHPPNDTPTYGWGSLHRFQIFKRNWNISISSSAIEFWLIPGVPLWGVGGGCMWVEGGERVSPTHMHTHMHTCAYTHAHASTHMYDIIGNSQGFPQWGRSFAWNYHVYHTCVCMHAHACMHVCVHMCRVHPPTTSHPHTPRPPTPSAAGSPKHQNSISLELIEIIRFCLKILYLWTFLNSYRL